MSSLSFGIADSAKPWTGTPAATIEFTASTFNANNRPDYTFNNVAIGSANSSRIVAVVVYTTQAGNSTSVTIGGISATRITRYNSSGTQELSIYAAAVPTGTTATIFIQLPDDAGRCGITVYKIVPGYSGTVNNADSGAVSTINDTEIVGGVSIIAAVNVSSSTEFTLSRNSVSLTPDSSALYSGNSRVEVKGLSVTGDPNVKSTSTYTAAVNNGIMAVAHWR